MTRYDPDRPPPAHWLTLDEQERIQLVEGYHKRAKIRLPKAALHAVIHVIVENQVAEGVAPVVETLDRLQEEGLDRHDALHAVGSVLANHLLELMKADAAPVDGNRAYFDGLRELTASAWRKLASD